MKIITSKDVEARILIVQLFFSFEALLPFVKAPNTSVHVECHFLLQSRSEDESAVTYAMQRPNHGILALKHNPNRNKLLLQHAFNVDY